jgi:choline dehydrogenase-like flavoprotein
MTDATTARRLAALKALADTYLQALKRKDDPTGLFAIRASDLGVPEALLAFVTTRIPEPTRAGLLRLIDLLAQMQLGAMPVIVRERVVLPALARTSADVAAALAALRSLTFFLGYGRGDNPLWPAIGYPGPPEVRAGDGRALPTVVPRAGGETLEADVVVIGSGAGGSVIAAELARAGRRVIVLEAGGQYLERELPAAELGAFAALYWRGGYQLTADGMVSVAAGATLGGGTTVNWTNCYRTPPAVRAQWAREFGLDGLDTHAFDEHLDAVAARIGAIDTISDDHGSNAILRAGASALGYAMRRTLRNADPATYDPRSAGHMGHGDRTGSKRRTNQTYLADAVEHGARILVRCRAERVLVERGHAVGVRAVYDDGAPVRVEVRARQVVIACGALETPALLLRSGIGGPAVGHHLRLHPAVALPAFYAAKVEPWLGAPQTTQVTEHLDRLEGHGFTLECAHFHPGLWAALIPFRSALEHKTYMGRIAHSASVVARLRERGGGRVTIDDGGEAVVRYPLTDPLDQRLVHEAIDILARVGEAAGAVEMVDLGRTPRFWRRGEDLAAFVDGARAVPFTPGARPYFSLHQMGSARMGRDPETSVADPRGELHTTRGVWIGDTSAFPTSTGANPMLTVMALARRTALAIAA